MAGERWSRVIMAVVAVVVIAGLVLSVIATP